MIKLTLTEKGGEPKVLTFDKDEITIGRVSGNDIVLAKGNVSKRHSKLSLRNGQMEISDLKSTNGTYVNGRKIAGPTPLASSDRIYVGDFLIGIEGLGGASAGADFGTDGAMGAAGGSGARRMPIPTPPPPPPPRRAGSSASHLPEDEETGGGDESEDDLGLSLRPRGGRAPTPPPPPPPPPRRPATPLVSRSVGRGIDDPFEDIDVPIPSAEQAGHEEDTGNVGLFAHSRRGDEDGEIGGASRRLPTGNRPGVGAPLGGSTLPSVGLGSETPAGAAPGLESLLADPGVNQILITGPDATLVDRGSGLSLHESSLGDPSAVADTLWRYANTAYPPPAPDNPVVDVRLPDGTRVSAAFPPAAPALVASIRRSTLPERTLADLIPGGNKEVQSFLDAVITTRRNIIVTGDGAALPSVLGAFASAIPVDRRVVAIGAGARSRSGWTDLSPTADMPALVRVAAALRPDHLVIGELAGIEVAELVLVATRGFEGMILAVPGRAAGETLTRLVALTAAGLGVPGAAATTAPSLLASAFDLIVTAVAATDGHARIIEVAEPRLAGSEVVADVALALYGDSSKRDPGAGRLQGRGVSARLGGAISAAGSHLPSSLVSK